ncbi:hypothetical protein CGRA01v4_07116 [Colletotrichum graminicola]|nr:hypothetical protein CGRA01v4_07116 [Colletotrichum graminicola]
MCVSERIDKYYCEPTACLQPGRFQEKPRRIDSNLFPQPTIVRSSRRSRTVVACDRRCWLSDLCCKVRHGNLLERGVLKKTEADAAACSLAQALSTKRNSILPGGVCSDGKRLTEGCLPLSELDEGRYPNGGRRPTLAARSPQTARALCRNYLALGSSQPTLTFEPLVVVHRRSRQSSRVGCSAWPWSLATFVRSGGEIPGVEPYLLWASGDRTVWGRGMIRCLVLASSSR